MMWRYRFSFFLFFASFLIIISRLFYWQVIKAEELSFFGQSQYGIFMKIIPQRGEIKTSDGYPIVANRLGYLVFANPKEIKDKKKTTNLLSSLLEVDSASVSASLSLNKFWVPLKQNVDNKKKEEIEKLGLPGIGFEEQFTRFYPEGSISAHLLGILGKDESGENKGYFGLEGYYDRQLRGKTGIAVEVRDAFGRPILSKMNDKSKKIDGRSLVLNIDRAIQFIVETKLKEGIEKYQASGGMVGVIEPKTGGVIAMAGFPSFDPGNYQDYPQEFYKNPFISNLFEPGSTLKSIIMSAALDSKSIEPETKCNICDGPITIGDYQIKTWNNKYYKDTNMIDVIVHSDNIGMVFVANSLGFDRMFSYLGQFGIGEITGIDLQGEIFPSLKPKHLWYPIDFATISFGQGISVSPIELLSAFCVIANEGKRMEPHVVSKIETPDGEIIKIQPKILGRPILPSTAKLMTEILVNAVNKGEAKYFKPKGYRIAGKTGTAQIPIAGHYDPNKTIASFIGFAPADNPKFAMLVIFDRPTTSIYGSETAAPVFFEIAKKILDYYNIPPTE